MLDEIKAYCRNCGNEIDEEADKMGYKQYEFCSIGCMMVQHHMDIDILKMRVKKLEWD